MPTRTHYLDPQLPADPIFTEGELFALYPGQLNLIRAANQCRFKLAALLDINPMAIWLNTPVPEAFTLTLPADGPYGYFRITYDPARRWTLCIDPARPPLDPDCAFPLPDAPPFEVMEAVAEHVVFIHRRRDAGETVAQAELAVPQRA